MNDVEVRGLRIAYQRVGQGLPLVLLHGALGDSRDWRPPLDALSDEFTVVAWDVPGCGRSSGSAGDVRVARLRRLPRRVRRHARAAASTRTGAVLGRRARVGALPAKPGAAAHVGAGVGLCRLGGLAALRDRRRVARLLPPRRRVASRPGRRRFRPKPAHRCGTARDGGRGRGDHVQVPSGRGARDGTRVHRGRPTRRPAHHRGSDAAGVGRVGCAVPAADGHGDAVPDPGIETRRDPGRRAPVQRRGRRPFTAGFTAHVREFSDRTGTEASGSPATWDACRGSRSDAAAPSRPDSPMPRRAAVRSVEPWLPLLPTSPPTFPTRSAPCERVGTCSAA